MFTVIIPARFASNRLPGKPLADIHAKPMIIRVMERALMSDATRVIVATDHQAVFDVVQAANGEVCMTDVHHQSGTERLAEVIEKYKFSDDEIIINVQGDEPLIPPEIINQLASNLMLNNVGMATLAAPINDPQEVFDPAIVKVVTDKQSNALYFSRAAIPWERDRFAVSKMEIGQHFLRHIGIYAYRAGFIRRYIQWSISPLETIEMLEQLRVLWYGEKIHVALALKTPWPGVDNQQDLDAVRKAFFPS
ncbi:3-deoxy-manno-octulosonate cytidylyltransferase [Arsenophonus endosymbiont of Bemisia tabaci]|uniref:3-deoxy-manno-octulosonate cytidylyltransferase n=1 Tax=Arsenophonus endosymbiont of Bemisia tabaci TaxID=536059 RepID=UPI0015F52E4B|nr:3-deoxy-manno-octulosonate cytidylyltransferase [Arsenophonus endosymbiont of Bemisia tabaci]CAA2930433.1 3-deoxy-manno-octulosonate cytidylyltransferase [Arsenophonus endosymbiont of Bemisia tabaci Q2]